MALRLAHIPCSCAACDCLCKFFILLWGTNSQQGRQRRIWGQRQGRLIWTLFHTLRRRLTFVAPCCTLMYHLVSTLLWDVFPCLVSSLIWPAPCCSAVPLCPTFVLNMKWTSVKWPSRNPHQYQHSPKLVHSTSLLWAVWVEGGVIDCCNFLF